MAEKMETWAQEVFKRAGYKCEWCGSTENIKAHHIINKMAHNLEDAYDAKYGMCLCDRCHKEYHTWNKHEHSNRRNLRVKVWRRNKK